MNQAKRIADGRCKSTQPIYTGGAVERHCACDIDLPIAACAVDAKSERAANRSKAVIEADESGLHIYRAGVGEADRNVRGIRTQGLEKIPGIVEVLIAVARLPAEVRVGLDVPNC